MVEHNQDELNAQMMRLLRHEKTIESYVHRLVRPNEVDDVMQEWRAAVWKSIRGNSEEIRKPANWLREVVRRVAFAWIREKNKQEGGPSSPVGQGGKRNIAVPVEDAEEEVRNAMGNLPEHLSDPATLFEREWRRNAVQMAINALPPDLKSAYIQIKLGGVPCSVLASQLGIARNTMISRISAAEDIVRRKLNLGAIKCIVTNKIKKKLSATVRLRHPDGSVPPRTCETNHLNTVFFEGLPPALYTIEVESHGCVTLRRTINVPIGLTQISIELFNQPVDETGTGGLHAES